RRGDRSTWDSAGLVGVDYAVVPQPRGGVPGIALRLVIVADRLLEGFRLLRRPFVSITVDGGEDACRLLAPHDADATIGPGEQEARAVGAPGHAVIAGAETAADQHRDLGHLRGSDGGDQLGAVLGDAFRLIL